MKNKTTAIVLSVFFSYWSWMYTYRRNSVKFWIGLSLNIIAIAVVFIAGLVFICITTEGHPEYIEYLRGFETFLHSNSADIPDSSYITFSIILLTLGIIIIFKTGVWVWALMDNATKSRNFYTDYPAIR